MEFFAREPSVISKWARHNVTGDRIPPELLKDALAKKQGFAGVDLQQQILLSAADQVSFCVRSVSVDLRLRCFIAVCLQWRKHPRKK